MVRWRRRRSHIYLYICWRETPSPSQSFKEGTYLLTCEMMWLKEVIAALILLGNVRENWTRNVDLSRSWLGGGNEDVWWKKTIVYQIYPRSFYDADADGVGDLLGIASKADYFKDIGVETIWLSPIYESPMADFGYDISNHTDIDPIFGTLEDFDKLMKEMHDRDIKVVLDFVPNHTSNKHEWFQKSLQKDPKYSDYYIWKDPLGYNETGEPIPPNNWVSVFRFSAWEWVPEREQFYFHQFLKEQPDLNYRNPDVVQDMKNVLRFWLNRGVDGFRVDAIQTLFEVEDVYGMDEPQALDSEVTDPTQDEYYNHTYTRNMPGTFVSIHGWKQVLDEYEDKLMMLEVYDDNVNEVMRYYGNDTYPISDFPFNFYLISNFEDRNSVTGSALKDVVHLWMDNMPEGRWPNWVLGNHDRNRVGSRFGTNLIDAMNMFTLLLPGTPITYYGEEIGMEDTFISFEDTQDPNGCNHGPQNYAKFSRDPERTPMQWNDTPFAGFTEGGETWLAVHENYLTVNVKTQSEVEEQSHLKVYKALTKLRREEAFKKGSLSFHVDSEEAVAFVRSLDGEPTYVIVINASEGEVTLDLQNGTQMLPETGTVIIRSSEDVRPQTDIGESITLSEVSLMAGEGVVLKLN